MHAKCLQPILLLSLLLCFPFRFLHNKVSNLLNQNGVREKPMSTTDENGEKNDLLYILSSTGHCLYQRMNNVPLAYV